MQDYFYAFFPILVNLVMLGLMIFRQHVNKNCGRRVLTDGALKRFERNLASPIFIAVIVMTFIAFLKEAGNFSSWSKLLSKWITVLPFVFGYFISSFIDVIGQILRYRSHSRRVIAINMDEKELITAVQAGLGEDATETKKPSPSWGARKYLFEDGNVKMVCNGAFAALTFTVKPDERNAELFKRVLETLRAQSAPFLETPPQSLRFSLSTLLLGTFMFGGLYGVYTSRKPWAKIAEWKPEAGQIERVLYSPDGTSILTQSSGATPSLRETIMWDVNTRQKRIELPQGFSFDAVFSPDGKHVALGGGSIVICDASTGKIEQTLTGHEANALAYSPDGKRLVCGSSDKSVQIWNVETGLIELGIPQKCAVLSVAFSPDGVHVAAGMSNGETGVWNVAGGGTLWLNQWSTTAINSVRYSPKGHQFATGSDDKYIRYLDVNTGTFVGAHYQTEFRVDSVRFSPDEREVLSGGESVQLRDSSTHNLLEEFAAFSHADFSPDGNRLIAAGSGTAAIWERRNNGAWWNVMKTPIFWIALAAIFGFLRSLYRDVQLMKATADR